MTTSVTVYLAPAPINTTQFIPGGNQPASGAQLFSYLAGTSTKQNTYTTSSGSVANTNPIILDSGGNVSASHEVWLQGGISYDFTLAPSTDSDPPVSPYWTAASLTGINDPSSVLNEWVATGSTATFVNASSMTFVGDVTTILSNQRRLKTVNTAGTLYSTVTSSVFSVSTTTLGIASDSTGIDTGLSAVSYGLIAPTSNSLPRGVYNVSSLIATGNVSSATVSTGSVASPILDSGSQTPLFLQTNNGSIGAEIASTAGTIVNHFATSPSTAGNEVSLYPKGTDSSIGLDIYSKGSKPIRLVTEGFGTGIVQVQISDTSSAVRSLVLSGGATNPTISTSAGAVSVTATLDIQTVTTVGASTATLTNSPHAGNPTVWPRISINGTTFCFPCFATT